ncbi:hypothetical protein SCLCIDRAFT_114711 [Scleroderma citrinum Foug A]|uniref:Uncharacterized protein n=1 Tax=Scleroderma citrinum Foug A TaxID=1036808 RepID=A0A0C3E9A7_9AGAM|nr:hypothetical protein SCLCIDRAFT_114711 [Scleroderma citrinum Foug A]
MPVPHSSPDLRRMTSNSTLLTPSHREHRVSTHPSQHLQAGSARLGSRSPSSIPSSPTSAHSSSSAIFERDIEPLGPPSPPTHTHPPNPHRIPRSKATEQLDQSVPSVLDTAAAILTSASLMEEDHIAVVTPACERNVRPSSGFASPIGSLRSRSPSPTGTTGVRTLSSAVPRSSLLLSVPSSPSAQPQPLPFPILNPSASPKDINQPQRLTLQTHPSVLSPSMSPPRDGAQTRTSPSINTPTSVYYSTVSSNDGSPTTTTLEHPPSILSANPTHLFSPSSQYSAAAPHTAVTSTGSPFTYPTTLSHPPSPTPNQKRLSFISYTDLLASTPASTVPLSSFTNCSAADPPPHIPRVSGIATHYGGSRGRERGGDTDRDRERSVSGGDRDSVLLFDDMGGEWAREGLGKGLEERLEALMTVP